MNMRWYFDQYFQTHWILHHPLVSNCFSIRAQPRGCQDSHSWNCTTNPWQEVMESEHSTVWCCLLCCHPQILGHCQELELHWGATLMMLLWSMQIFGALFKDLWAPRKKKRVEVGWTICCVKHQSGQGHQGSMCFFSCIPPCHWRNHTSFFAGFVWFWLGWWCAAPYCSEMSWCIYKSLSYFSGNIKHFIKIFKTKLHLQKIASCCDFFTENLSPLPTY